MENSEVTTIVLTLCIIIAALSFYLSFIKKKHDSH